LRGRSLLTLESGSSDESGSGVCDEVAIAAAAGAADVEGGMVKTSYTRSGNRKAGRTRCPMKKSGGKPRGEFSRGYPSFQLCILLACMAACILVGWLGELGA
jgi:hypothetical protein